MTTEPRLFADRDLTERIDAPWAVARMRDAVIAAETGDLTAPPRVHADLGDGRLAFTAGRLGRQWYGYRSYDTVSADPSGDQLVVVHQADTGRIAALAVGHELGRIRTGAIGGVAVDALADPDATELGLIGTGPQAWMQLWAIAAVRPLRSVTVYSRDRRRREALATNATERHGFPVTAVDSAEQAVAGRSIVVLATNSGTPVVDPNAIDADAFVTTMGPKQVGRSEFDVLLAESRQLVVTDSPAQLRAYDPPFILSGTEQADRAVSLGAVLAGAVARRPGALFCSVGLAGTEVFLLASLLTE